MACTEPSMKRINVLTKQLEKIEEKQTKTEAAFDKLVEECAQLDNFLRKNNNPKPEMQLLRAYLQQYEDERDAIKQDIEFSYSQIKDLKDDFINGLYDETQRDEYLKSEEKAVKTIEAKLDYFIDRFKKQSEFIKSVEKQ
jgi:hypothetical protein